MSEPSQLESVGRELWAAASKQDYSRAERKEAMKAEQDTV